MANDSKILDNLNWKILVELQKNARISFKDIGDKVGLSGPAVAERIQKLEENGIIKGYHAKIDLKKIGYSLTAIVNFKFHPGNLDKFLNHLKSLPEVFECNRITGSESMVIKVAIKEPSHLERLVNGFIEFGSPTTSIVLSMPIENRIFEA
jgi:Lrp/AsnC family leucine-responsive transcriptional regulator